MKSLIKILIVLAITNTFVLAENDANAPAKEKPKAPASENEVPDVNSIIQKAQIAAYYQGDDGKAKVKMTIVNEQGQERNREFIILRKDIKDGGNQKYYVYFQRPADVREMVYMVHKHAGWKQDDDRWLYLPSLDLVKRIAASDKRTSFVGSNYLYEDVSGRSPDADKHTITNITEDLYVIKSVPKSPDMVDFNHYMIYIDKKTFLPMQIRYVNDEFQVYRTIEIKEVKDIQGFPTPVKSVVTDRNTEGYTVMEYSDVQYNIELPDVFTERYLRRPPRIVLR